MDDAYEDPGRAVICARAELNSAQRLYLGPTESIGDLVVAVGVPVVLWNDVAHGPLLLWGLLVALTVFGWDVIERTRPTAAASTNALLTWFGWASTIMWGILPWVAWPALDTRGVVWILVFVVIFGIAADTVFVTQASSISVDEMVLAYVASYLVAFALTGAYAAIVATIAAGATFIIGGAGLGRVTGELVAKRVESERRSQVDDLTGLSTRAGATSTIASLIAGGAAEVHCAFFDIDDFKQVNDNYGYETGDEALRVVAGVIVDGLPADWTVARFGGDEFVAVGTTPAALQPIVDMHLSLSAHGGLVLSQPLSVGVTCLPATKTTPDDLFQEGAAALRMAKRLGKHQVVEMTDELRVAERATAQLRRRAGAALEEREIVPWAQPIVDLHNGSIVGMELLARWPQADGSMVMPDEFVPVIEDQGRGPGLGLLMIEHAVEALSGPELRDSSVYISVNVSAKHLFHRRLPVEILDMLADKRVAPRRLVVEITESQHLPSSPIWRETARGLRSIGVGLAIDDFGTGYSSMEQLQSMPFSHLKVDRVITQAVGQPGAMDLAAAIAAMARGSHMVTIAEGIETEAERSMMLAAGYSFGQGYLYARPSPLADLLTSIADQPTPSKARPTSDGICATLRHCGRGNEVHRGQTA